ncbi:Os06g0623850 [Oryza sativa Japonica Group]|uniref:Os06g0623850 protein n=1 Tax=Oryza sativa subsp. japonica TaxID=39947 RepID=A0A0P0WZC2_ORYSJ|nr:Os06g0623850 [Oryza sativa Japonica Group]
MVAAALRSSAIHGRPPPADYAGIEAMDALRLVAPQSTCRRPDSRVRSVVACSLGDTGVRGDWTITSSSMARSIFPRCCIPSIQ